MKALHILLIGHYPIDVLDRAPKVRIYRMAESLARLGTVTVVAGTRRDRDRWLGAEAMAEILAEVDGIYVESASSTATLADLRLLQKARRRGVPVAVFVRDYYQHFPQLYPLTSWRARGMKVLYWLTLHAYARLATIVYVPTPGLGALLPRADIRLLPPGAHTNSLPEGLGAGAQVPSIPPSWVVYVGAGGRYDGVELLIDAVAALHERRPDVECALIMRAAEWPRQQEALPSYIHLCEASGPELAAWYARALVAVIPRPDTAYTRLAWPVKLMDYVSYGVPVIVTDRSEAARFVEHYEIGLVSESTAKDLAEALERAVSSPDLQRLWRANIVSAVRDGNSWDDRAQTVMRDLLAAKKS